MRGAQWLGLGLLLLRCSQQSLPPPGQLFGTYGLALYGDLLFVTSIETAELKVIDLNSPSRDWVRAPNPLEPLSIPVLDRPVALARDLANDGGTEIPGPYLYVQGQSSAAISIVGTKRSTQLIELARLPTSGVVTAMAARGPDPSRPDAGSTLYYATLDTSRCSPTDAGSCTSDGGSQATLWQANIPPVDPATQRLTGISPIPRWTSQTPINALLALPNSSNLAVATRNQNLPDGGLLRGTTLVLNPQTGPVRTLQFPTSVRFLTTNPAASVYPADGGEAVTRVFGILEEESCGTVGAFAGVDGGYTSADGGYQCPAMMAVDTTGQRSTDVTGMGMIPLSYGNAFPMSIALSAGGLIAVPNANPDPAGNNGPTMMRTLSNLGIIPASDSNIYFFDADELRALNANPDVDGGGRVLSVSYLNSDGGLLPYLEGPDAGSVAVGNGAARDETISIVFQGTISGFQGLPSPAMGQSSFPVSGAPLSRVVIGDRIVVLGSADAGCPDYSGDDTGLTISQVDAGVLFSNSMVPCQATSFSVRASGNQPYVVAGTATGYMGRTGANQLFTYGDLSSYFYHPCTPGISPCQFDRTMLQQLRFGFGAGDPAIHRDYAYQIDTLSGFVAEFIQLDTTPGFTGFDYQLPTAAVNVTTVPDGGQLVPLNHFFVTYPSANAVVEFDPVRLILNSANRLAAFPHN
jgi:hypothetical protein